MSNKDKESEQYADWSVAYLNDFIADKSGKYKVYESNAAFNKILKEASAPISDYTVFLKKGSPAYHYDGVIVEAMVYTAVDNKYNKKGITDMDRAFYLTLFLFNKL